MSQSSNFAAELIFRAGSNHSGFPSLLNLLRDKGSLWPLNQPLPSNSYVPTETNQVWNVLGSNLFTLRDWRLDGVRHNDDWPYQLPTHVVLTAEVWRRQPTVRVEASFPQEGLFPVSFTVTLDYNSPPSDLKNESLFHHWLKAFFEHSGLSPAALQQVPEFLHPLGIDALSVTVCREDSGCDILHSDITVSTLATKPLALHLLPMFPVTTLDLSCVTTTPGPLLPEDAPECLLNGSFLFHNCRFDFVAESPYDLIEINMVEGPPVRKRSRDLAAASVLSIADLASLFDQTGQTILAGLPFDLRDISMTYEPAAGEFFLDAVVAAGQVLKGAVAVTDASLRIAATGQKILAPTSIVLDGLFLIPQAEGSAWFEATVEFEGNQQKWISSLRLKRESNPEVTSTPLPLLDLILIIPKFCVTPTPVYLDQTNVIYHPEQRGGDYNMDWEDKFPK